MVTLLIMWMEPPALKVPDGTSTIPPPALLAAAIALFIAGVSLVEPLPVAPNDFTLNTGVAAGCAGCALADAPPCPYSSNPMAASTTGQLRRNTARPVGDVPRDTALDTDPSPLVITISRVIVCKRFHKRSRQVSSLNPRAPLVTGVFLANPAVCAIRIRSSTGLPAD